MSYIGRLHPDGSLTDIRHFTGVIGEGEVLLKRAPDTFGPFTYDPVNQGAVQVPDPPAPPDRVQILEERIKQLEELIRSKLG